MRFLVDAQLPPALARWRVSKGYEAEHVADVGLASAPDNEIWRYALAVGSVIISKDEDFALRKVMASEGPALVWVRLPNSRRRELLSWFEQVLPHIDLALKRGESQIEVV
jgi:predicted nuclease of predicted toxin-antitoxin system